MSSQVPLRFNAKLYQATHGFQIAKVSDILDKFNSKINWKKATRIMDIGCGPGNITVDDLLSRAPDNVEMTAVDISPDMVKLASETFNDTRLKFVVGDISDPKFGENYKERFDIVFSLYCLHYVQNQQQAMKNIYQTLRPGGQTLITIIATHPIFTLDKIIAKREKWAPYMQVDNTSPKEVISPYYNDENAEVKARNFLLEAGFEVEDCIFETINDKFPSKELFYDLVKSLNPYIINIPENQHQQYFEECQKEYFSGKSGLVTVSDGTGEVSYSYTRIISFARKR